MYDILKIRGERLFQKIAQGRMYQKIVDQVLESILSGELKAGDKLPPEKGLGKIFGVSRVTVREAVRSLEQSGVIEVRQGSFGGAFIREIDIYSIAGQIKTALRLANPNLSQLTAARSFFEEMILLKFESWNRKKDHLADLTKLVDQAEKYFEEGLTLKGYEANREFHCRIAQICGNPIIVLWHKVISDLLFEHFRKVDSNALNTENTIKKHRNIIQLIQDGKYQEAAQICSKHLGNFTHGVEKKYRSQSALKRLVKKAKG